MRSKDEVDAEIARLAALLPKVRKHTAFGDDNRAAIEAQIEVLREGLDENDIWDRWPEDDEDMHTRASAQDAHSWLHDSEAESPADSWADLVVER